ncbi:MAG: hypothetical protein WC708_16455 [Lentisphaeria bacterium]
MPQKPIKTEKENDAALKRFGKLLAANPVDGTPEFDEMMVLSALIRQFEDAHYAFAKPDPIAAIRFRMEQQGLRPADMTPYFGTISRFYEVMAGGRRLTLPMIRKLNHALGIPADILIRATASDSPGYSTDLPPALQVREADQPPPPARQRPKPRPRASPTRLANA